MQVHRDRINLVGMIKRRRQTDVQKRGAMLTCLYFVKPCHQIWNDGYFSFNFGHKKPTCCIHLIPNADQPRGKIEGAKKKRRQRVFTVKGTAGGSPSSSSLFFFCCCFVCSRIATRSSSSCSSCSSLLTKKNWDKLQAKKKLIAKANEKEVSPRRD